MLNTQIEERCKGCDQRIGWIELFGSLALACFKLFIGIVSSSHALIGSAFYSIQDMMTAGITIFSVKYAGKEVDEEHPYGHGKIEFIASVAISIVIIIGAITLFFIAGKSIITGPKHTPGFLALLAAVIAFFANELMYRYSLCAGITFNSPSIISNAQHTRADSISSACVAIGIVLTKMGLYHIDPIIAVFEVIHILVITTRILIRGIKGLMDTALPEKEIKEIREIIKNVPQVKEIVLLRTRQVGQRSQVDCEITLQPDLKLSQANGIISQLKNCLKKEMPLIGNVNIFIAPARVHLWEEKQKTERIRKILHKYYSQFIKTHDLKISQKRIKLSLHLLSGVSLLLAQKVSNRIGEEIRCEVPDTEVIVEIKPTNKSKKLK